MVVRRISDLVLKELGNWLKRSSKMGGNEEGWASLVVVHGFHFTRSLLSSTALDFSLYESSSRGNRETIVGERKTMQS